MNVKSCVSVLVFLLPMCMSGQSFSGAVVRKLASDDIRLSIRAGYNIGGTLPVPLPSEVKSVNSYDPGLNLGVGVDVEKMFTPKWGVGIGLRVESEGMDTKVTVEDYFTRLSRGGDEISGNYTGRQTTSVNCTCLTLPVVARYRLADGWTLSAGLYAAYMLKRSFKGEAAEGYMRMLDTDPVTGEMAPIGNKVEIPRENPASYDFSSDMRRFLWGVEMGVDWLCYDHLMFFANLNWGLNDVFRDTFSCTISFPMYSVYATFGFGYRF